MELTDRQRGLRDDFMQKRGYWNAFWDSLLQLDPNFFEAYVGFSGVPWSHGILDPKVKEFVYIAVDGSTTHLYSPGLRQHIGSAIRLGATKEELLEVLELTSTIGIHTCTTAVPILIEELVQAGTSPNIANPTERQLDLKAQFEHTHGYWNQYWDGLLAVDVEFFAAFAALASVPWRFGVLPPKVKELIYIAVNASATHLYQPGLRQHIRNAIRLGALPQEIMEVFELASIVGIHTCTVGVPVLIEEAAAAQPKA